MATVSTFKAAVIENFNSPLTIKDVTLPELPPNRILVKNEVTGLCHTDLHVIEGGFPGVEPRLPLVPGHEGVGHVVAIGSEVDNVEIGDRVCTPWLHTSCLNCEYCEKGWETLCLTQERTGFSVDGTFAQYTIADPKFVGRVPPTLKSEQAAPIACAGITVYKALKMAQLNPSEYVVIVGAGGGLGHLAVQYANYMGYKVIGVDVGKKDFLESIGCTHVVSATEEDVITRINEITGTGANAAVCVVPQHQAVENTVYYVKPGGSIVMVGLPPHTIDLDGTFVILKGLRIVGSIVGTRQDLQEALEIAAKGHVECNVKVRPFSELQESITELYEGNVNGRLVLKL